MNINGSFIWMWFYVLLLKHHFTKQECRYLDFLNQFQLCNVHLFLRKQTWANDKEQEYKIFFSDKAWLKLDATEKAKHSLGECCQCQQVYSEEQVKFPTLTKHREKKPLKNIIVKYKHQGVSNEY